MSVDTHSHHQDLSHHEEALEVVDARERFGVWLFIGGDIVTTSAILFMYLYLRGVNTGGHWMNMIGLQGHSFTYYANLNDSSAGLPAQHLVTVNPMSAGLTWLVTLVVVVSAALLWLGERGLRATKNNKAFSSMALLSAVLAVLAVVLCVVQLHHIPAIFHAENDSLVMAYTTYSSCMMAIVGFAMIHFVILAFLGLGLSIRSARGVINGEDWFQARLVRLFWVWVAVSSVIVSAIVTSVNTIH